MSRVSLSLFAVSIATLALLCYSSHGQAEASNEDFLAPVAVAPRGDAGFVVLGAHGRLVLLGSGGEVQRSLSLKVPTSGIALDGNTAYVTTNEPAGRVLRVSLESGVVEREYRAGHMPSAPLLSADGHTLYIANRFENAVALLDLGSGAIRKVPTIREPCALALTADGARLFVANCLPEVRPFLDDENPVIAAEVSVLDTAGAQVICHIELPNGAQSLRGIALSPDGRHAAVSHVLSNFTIPTMSIARGAMNRSAVSLIDTTSLHCAATVILDDPELGAANPWEVEFTADGKALVVTLAGAQELSVIDWPALLDRIAERGRPLSLFEDDTLRMLEGIRKRIKLPVNGPRALALANGFAFAPGYFSDTLGIAKLDGREARSEPLGERCEPSQARLGEQYFNDATLCFQGWQSCATCHPNGRSDALYWDLLNDGAGNTKNTKSLFMAALTPPAMWRASREDVEVAVRAGIEHIQFATPFPGQSEAIVAYLTEMKTVPSPFLNAEVLESPKTKDASCAKCHYPGVPRGVLTEAAKRGKALFEGKGGCVDCHPHPRFTTMKMCDPGFSSGVKYDIPALAEIWRDAPYLHSGDALSIRESITDFNVQQRLGKTKDMSGAELEDLVTYLKSL